MAIPACPLSLSLTEDTQTNNLTNRVKTLHSAKDEGINDTQMGNTEVWFYKFYWKMGGQQ